MQNFKAGDTLRFKPGLAATALGYKDGDTLVVRKISLGGYVVPLGSYPDGTEPEAGLDSGRFELVPAAQPKKPRDYVADHARRTLREAGLDAEAARRWVRNVQLHGKDWPCGPALRAVCTEDASGALRVDLSKLSRDTRGVRLQSLISDAFQWGHTPEGVDYWRELHSALR